MALYLLKHRDNFFPVIF